MTLLKSFTLNLIACWALLAVAVAQPATPQINLIIEREGVRFDRTGNAAAWQIEVFNETGELVFASGVTHTPSLAWGLQDQQGHPLASGLYNYRLRMQNETGDLLATQTGHVMVNRASTNDRIWVTSNRKTGVGAQDATDLTVISADDSAIGGAQLAREADTRHRGDSTRTTQDNKTSTKPVLEALGPITGDGVANRFARFTSANVIDDSLMLTEVNSHIRINTAVTRGRLSVYNGTDTAIHGDSASGIGIHGNSLGSVGVHATSVDGTGMYGYSQNSTAVRGLAPNGIGVLGESSASTGVRGTTGSNSASAAGVYGINTGAGSGVRGDSTNGDGVVGASTNFIGVRGVSDSFDISQSGVRGVGVNAAAGVRGEANTASGVSGISNAGNGVTGATSGNNTVAGVMGTSSSYDGRGVIGRAHGNSSGTAQGVRGESNYGTGVYGLGGATGTGVIGSGNTGVIGNGVLGPGILGTGTIAGQFNGRVNITGNTNVGGTLSKGAGSFKIDHPLDPENKYLYHSFVESPDMMNIYNGTITTDENGVATVTMPGYFEALNRDFRYQLTVIGQFAQAIVAEKIAANHFTIKTDKPNVEVSWQVTGVRQDAFANKHRIPNEVEKAPAERGYYLHPEAFGKPLHKSIEAAGKQ